MKPLLHTKYHAGGLKQNGKPLMLIRRVMNLNSLDMWFEKGITKQKETTSTSLTTLKPLTVCITTKCGEILQRQEYQTTLPAS